MERIAFRAFLNFAVLMRFVNLLEHTTKCTLACQLYAVNLLRMCNFLKQPRLYRC